MDTNDNQVTIKLLNDVSCILQGIESDNAAHIDAALTNLKKHTADFEAVFHKNLVTGMYHRPEAINLDKVADMVSSMMWPRTAFSRPLLRREDLP